MTKQPVLILGVEPRISISIARSLHQQRIPVAIAGLSPQDPRMSSSAVRHFLQLPGYQDQAAEFLLPILPFLVQVFPTPGKETIAWGGFMIIPRRRGVPGRRSCGVDLRLGCRQGLERGEYRIRREFRIQHARLRGLDLYRNGARNKALARESHRERTVGRKLD